MHAVYGTVVFGTDGSPASGRAGATAAMVARATSSRLLAVTASASTVGVDDLLAAARDAAERDGVPPDAIDTLHVAARPGDALVAVADERDAGLVTVARNEHPDAPLSDLSRWLMRNASADLLIVSGTRPDPHAPYERIVIASDGSATADRAARKGFDLAREIYAKVTLVFVGHPATGRLVMDDTIDVYGRGIETEVLLLEGDPTGRISSVATEIGAGLVVVGNKGVTGAKGYLLGSVPEKVIEGAVHDVLLCRTVVQIVADLRPGEGGVIERRGEKLACFMSDEGEMRLFSARCTHMGCIVDWNPGERTFDCPCHGSRFSASGEVVNGPAQRPLPPA